ncbi:MULTISPECIES: TonB-dependent receptor [unclassified Flavobacterium]|uniref:TonB-dependent receptor n=1 Tax=unclassified Flavobacterium TaxID=196869 RepID=UPI000EAE9311|nr:MULTISPECIES: TonB-dependent receptor [unclassified Flavobacterium]RKS00989.1 TonB-dependent receptor-like protein [Flavobacterium sp. 102]
MKKLVISTLFVMQVFFVFAQTTTGITGKVVDSKTQKPLQNVVASIQNTVLTTLTDGTGAFIFKDVPKGSQLVQIKSAGYKDQLLVVEVETGKLVDLGVIVFEEDITSEQQLSLVTITENDLGDDNSGSESTSGLLQATRDVYQQSAAFNWGQARFRIRGLDNEYGTTMINGIVMNKLYDGRPQWSNWGGLNDATRNQEFTMGSAPSDYTFGNALGTQEINARASVYRPGSRISMSGTNTNYSWRMMGTHASGLNKDGWAYVVSASRRWAQEGYFDGTDYSANSLFASVEKKFNEKHSLNITSIFAQNSRGKSSPNTQEVTDLMGVKYNSYWGWQDGKKRNSRDKDVDEPMVMLSHYWKLSERTSLNTNLAYQTGRISNSRLENPLGNNPDPTYYRKLPSYYYNDPTQWIIPPGGTEPINPGAELAREEFLNNSQIDWNSMYIANQNTATGESAFVLTEQRNDDTSVTANMLLNSSLSNNISFNSGVNFRNVRSHNYAVVTDLLGGDYFLNVDRFFLGDNAQFDLNNPNQQVVEGGTAGYNYNLFANVVDGFTQFKFNYSNFDFYLAQTFSRSEYQREGLYRSGNYADNSFGKGKSKVFENFGFKGGLTYKLSGQHYFDFNGMYLTKAPNLRNSFYNARRSNEFTEDLTSENIVSADASYILRMPGFKARLTGFFSRVKDATEIAFFYAENVGDNEGDEDSFITEIATGIQKQNLGAELGLEYQITSTIKVTGAASYGQYIYSGNARLQTSDDALASQGLSPLTDFGTIYLKNYHQPGMPQQAYSLGLEYRDPNFWWVGANVNYLSDSYISISKIMRTDNFSIDDATGDNYSGATPETVRDILEQEKFNSFTLVNLTGGKSWRISKKSRDTFGIFATVNNLFDIEYKTGGFEQSRKATFPDLQADNANGTPSFGPKYFYGYGRTYFVNFYINF